MDTLIKCVEQNLGFSRGKPVAAITIYRCLVQWRSFEAEKTNIFDRLIRVFGAAMEVLNFIYVNHHTIIFLYTHVRSEPMKK